MYWFSITNFSKFMFWNCFSYDKKNFCHIFKDETMKKRKLIKKIINEMNKRLKSIMKIEWKFNNAIRKFVLQNVKKMKSEWKWNKTHDKIKRKIKNDIDWFRHQKQIFFCWYRSFWNVKKINFTFSSWKTMFYHMFRKCKINELLFFFWRRYVDLSQSFHEY